MKTKKLSKGDKLVRAARASRYRIISEPDGVKITSAPGLTLAPDASWLRVMRHPGRPETFYLCLAGQPGGFVTVGAATAALSNGSL